MEELQRSRSYANGQVMQMETFYGGGAPPPSRPYDLSLRSYSSNSYAIATQSHNQIVNYNYNLPKDFKYKKGKSFSAGSSLSKSLSLADPELQRRKRVASYKMYSVEGKIKGSFRKSFRWLKNKYSNVVYGW